MCVCSFQTLLPTLLLWQSVLPLCLLFWSLIVNKSLVIHFLINPITVSCHTSSLMYRPTVVLHRFQISWHYHPRFVVAGNFNLILWGSCEQLYHPFWSQEDSWLVSFTNYWPVSYNPQSKDTTGDSQSKDTTGVFHFFCRPRHVEQPTNKQPTPHIITVIQWYGCNPPVKRWRSDFQMTAKITPCIKVQRPLPVPTIPFSGSRSQCPFFQEERTLLWGPQYVCTDLWLYPYIMCVCVCICLFVWICMYACMYRVTHVWHTNN